jgi:hypothetical protein
MFGREVASLLVDEFVEGFWRGVVIISIRPGVHVLVAATLVILTLGWTSLRRSHS